MCTPCTTASSSSQKEQETDGFDSRHISKTQRRTSNAQNEVISTLSAAKNEMGTKSNKHPTIAGKKRLKLF
jgi:hypothetical protein